MKVCVYRKQNGEIHSICPVENKFDEGEFVFNAPSESIQGGDPDQYLKKDVIDIPDDSYENFNEEKAKKLNKYITDKIGR